MHCNVSNQLLYCHLMLALIIGCWFQFSLACGPGRAGFRARRIRRYPPLIQREYIPKVGEHTLGASGRPEGPIKRADRRFRELVEYMSPDIEFRNDEKTGADRMMTQVSFSGCFHFSWLLFCLLDVLQF